MSSFDFINYLAFDLGVLMCDVFLVSEFAELNGGTLCGLYRRCAHRLYGGNPEQRNHRLCLRVNSDVTCLTTNLLIF